MTETERQERLEEYCFNNMEKLKQTCYPKICKIGGISQKDHDDLHSIALEALRDSVERYNDSHDCKFSTFLNGNIERKFNTYIRNKNRIKRNGYEDNPISFVSLDTPIGEEENATLSDIIPSGFNIEEEVSKKMGFSIDDKVEKYLNSLSVKQRGIAELIMEGYRPSEIKEKLKLTEKQYIYYIKDMKSFEKSRVLRYMGYVRIREEKKMRQEVNTQTLEKNKDDRLSVFSIIKKIDNYTVRFDHPLQRSSEQWDSKMKGNLISDILQGNPIPEIVFAEQVINNLAIVWDIDGKQRCTNVHSYRYDEYRVNKNVTRGDIFYQAIIKDKNGKPILDKNGFPQSEKREFDIRGKKFSELPEELQDRFLDYDFKIVQYLNCSSEDIAYHIARYNNGRPMNASQRGITRIGEEFASIVKNISAMSFFKELGGYKVSEGKNGTVDRVVVESVMATNFLNDWKKKQEDMCEYIKENASIEHFECFEEMVDRITNVGNEEVYNMFDSKDSFIWFGLFARFADTGLEDEKFIEFMKEFTSDLHNKVVDGISFDDLNGKSTKDKSVVVGKIMHLEKLMQEYLHITNEEDKTEEIATLNFVKDNVDKDITEEDISDYEEDLQTFIHGVDDKSKLLDGQNHNSIIAIIAYSYEAEIPLDDWFIEFFNRNNTYMRNQKANYLYMKQDLDKFLNKEKESYCSIPSIALRCKAMG
ncbi:hypothetical protein [Anaerosporobacter sp.]|uniref:hypothetical protein n=1 Tax=Anaerosporobacter sp. TaxID=1872529 RepID=UPI00286EE925|nr:hypothetical protein [Anaerosporobacter sp.]